MIHLIIEFMPKLFNLAKKIRRIVSVNQRCILYHFVAIDDWRFLPTLGFEQAFVAGKQRSQVEGLLFHQLLPAGIVFGDFLSGQRNIETKRVWFELTSLLLIGQLFFIVHLFDSHSGRHSGVCPDNLLWVGVFVRYNVDFSLGFELLLDAFYVLVGFFEEQVRLGFVIAERKGRNGPNLLCFA